MTGRFTYRSDPVRIVFGAGAIAALRAEADFHKMSRLMVLCSTSRADFARRVTASIADRCVGFCDASAPNMPREAFERIVDDIKRHKRRRLRRHRRRLADRARQGRGGDDQDPLHRRRHHLFRLGDGGAVAHRHCRRSHQRRRPGGAARDRDLRSRTDARSAAAHFGGQRHERHGACGGEPLRHRHQSGRAGHGRGSGPKTRGEPAAPGAKSARSRMPEPKCSTAPGSRRISAPRSGSNTPSRNACGNGSISTTPTPTPSRRPMRSASTPPRRRKPWRASSARSASSDAARGLYDLNVRLGLPTGLKGLGMREEDIGKAVDVVAAVKISHPRPVSKADLAEVIRQAFFGEPPRF